MHWDDGKAALGGLLVVLLVVGGTSYAAYKYGRHAERRMLKPIIEENVEASYSEGFMSGVTWGQKEGQAKCLQYLDQLDAEEKSEKGRY